MIPALGRQKQYKQNLKAILGYKSESETLGGCEGIRTSVRRGDEKKTIHHYAHSPKRLGAPAASKYLPARGTRTLGSVGARPETQSSKHVKSSGGNTAFLKNRTACA